MVSCQWSLFIIGSSSLASANLPMVHPRRQAHTHLPPATAQCSVKQELINPGDHSPVAFVPARPSVWYGTLRFRHFPPRREPVSEKCCPVPSASQSPTTNMRGIPPFILHYHTEHVVPRSTELTVDQIGVVISNCVWHKSQTDRYIVTNVLRSVATVQ